MFPYWIHLFLYLPVLQTLILLFPPQFLLILNSSQISALILHHPPPSSKSYTYYPSLNTTPTNTPTITPKTSPFKLQPRKPLTLPLSDTEFLLTPFDFTPTHAPPHHHPHIPDPSPRDNDASLFRNIIKTQPRNPILVPKSLKGRRRHSQFDPSLPLLKPCKHSQPKPTLPTPKSLTIPVLECFEKTQ